jgi:hypothetical protein
VLGGAAQDGSGNSEGGDAGGGGGIMLSFGESLQDRRGCTNVVWYTTGQSSEHETKNSFLCKMFAIHALRLLAPAVFESVRRGGLAC